MTIGMLKYLEAMSNSHFPDIACIAFITFIPFKEYGMKRIG